MQYRSCGRSFSHNHRLHVVPADKHPPRQVERKRRNLFRHLPIRNRTDQSLEGLRLLESPFDPLVFFSTSDGTRDALNRFGTTISKTLFHTTLKAYMFRIFTDAGNVRELLVHR